MPALDSKLRSQLDDVCQKARDQAVAYAQSALQKRGVDAAEALSHFGPKDKELRNRLRARGRQVGDVRSADGTQTIDQLSQELAYEYWHRMLFARFLAENHLLMHPDGVAVSLEECDELAPEADPPAANGFVLAARYASTMLPQIFRTDDVLLEIEFAPEQRLALERELAKLPKQTFEADDSLGWVYQFWQTAEKKRVNDSGDKIDGRTLSAVTQLFTEHYMVEFLLHNTIGAWWCAKESIQGPPGGAGIPAGKSPVEMPYLRWRDDGTPAAGKFAGWPKTLAEFTMLDPCCGSGHFLVAAFNLLVPLRMHDEELTAAEACEAVLRDNIFGLELDPRCTQIAAFALAVAAWKYPEAGGYRQLPSLNIACSGQGVTGKKEEWLALAQGNNRISEGMERLYSLFKDAKELGSLIDPRREIGDLIAAGFAELRPLIDKALAQETFSKDIEASTLTIFAKGIAAAADYLSRTYHLVATNVPFLARGKQSDSLKEYCVESDSDAKKDLATSMLRRCIRFAGRHGVAAIVSPQAWLYLAHYTKLRSSVLTENSVQLIAALGPNAFDSISGEVVNVSLTVIAPERPSDTHQVFGVDATSTPGAIAKSELLRSTPVAVTPQRQMKDSPDHVISFASAGRVARLGEYVRSYAGIQTGDYPRFGRCFWELPVVSGGWAFQQSTIEQTCLAGGLEQILFWENGKGQLYDYVCEKIGERQVGSWIRGGEAWGKRGVLVKTMGRLPVTTYLGELFDNNVAVIVPFDQTHLRAIWAFAKSDEFDRLVRGINQKVNVDVGYFENLPFDLKHWQAVSKNDHSIDSPTTTDVTQWLFDGSVVNSTAPLEVALSVLMGFHWPKEVKTGNVYKDLEDKDGVVCFPAVRGEATAAARLLEILRTAFGSMWSDSLLHKLLTEAGCKAGTTLDDWLRNQFFEQHCKRFQNRPFIWHIWDGRKDGFSALVNYHKLTHKTLENLTYSYLGDWITAQSKSDKAGADLRLGAAQALQEKLKLILAGEPPYDIFVRWKPLHEQAIGWNPDLNDGVRMNIRPFIEAGILRKNPNIKWTKDRGKEPQRDKADYPWFWSGKDFIGDRVNDIHLTNAEKQAARSRRKGAK